MRQTAFPSAAPLYGSGLLADIGGEALRPGGTELSESLIAAAGFAHGEVVLDIGCGRGTSLTRLAARGCLALGVDIAPEAVAIAQRTARVLRASGAELPLADACADGVLAECSLSLMPHRRRVLAEWARVMRPGAALALSDVFARVPAERSERGLADSATLADEIAGAGLALSLFEDCSEVLKPWVARFVFRYGSLEALWNGACGLSAESARRAAPGYFLLVAYKQAGGCHD